MEALEKAKAEVLEGCRLIAARDYVLGAAGNISARAAGSDLVVITPAGGHLGEMREQDLVVVDLEGRKKEGAGAPSSEWPIHREIYRHRKELTAVVHTHSLYATAASSLERLQQIPVIDIEMVLHMGGDIRVAPFELPGSEELARSVTVFLGDRMCALLAHHGNVCVGRSMKQAVNCCDNLERSCEMYFAILSAGQTVSPIPQEYLQKAVKVFRQKQLGEGQAEV